MPLGRIEYLDNDSIVISRAERQAYADLDNATGDNEEMARPVRDTDAIYQSNPLGLPSGFFLVKTPMGKRLGFGFYANGTTPHPRQGTNRR